MLAAWYRIDREGTMVNARVEVALGDSIFKWSLGLSGGHGLCNKPSRPLEDSRNKSFVQNFISGYQKCIYCHLMQYSKVIIKAVFTFTSFTPEFAFSIL